MFGKKKLDYASFAMPTSEELNRHGIKELTYEELLLINGGKRKSCSSSRSSGSSSSGGSSSGSSYSAERWQRRSCSSGSSSKGSSSGSPSGRGFFNFRRKKNNSSNSSTSRSSVSSGKNQSSSSGISKKPLLWGWGKGGSANKEASASDSGVVNMEHGQKTSLGKKINNAFTKKVHGSKKSSSKWTAGYVLDENAVGGAGHAGWFVSNGKGGYSFFEVIGLRKDAKNKKGYKDKDNHEGDVLSCTPLVFPTGGTAKLADHPAFAGVLRRDFSSKEDMLKYLRGVGSNDGFDKITEFNITQEQSKTILDASDTVGTRYQGYELFTNSCGIIARDVLTVPDSGISQVAGVSSALLGPVWASTPRGIGELLYMKNWSIANRYEVPTFEVP